MIYREKERELNAKRADVVVVGSGPAGIGAALSAARNGCSVVLIEQCGALGGIATSGMMSQWTGRVDDKIYHEILSRSAERNEGEHKGIITITIDPEKLKTLYLEMMQEADVEVLLYTFFSDVIMEGNTVKGVIIENKTGRSAIFADCVIDASGDGDVAYKAGADFILGRESDNKMQPCTIMFKVGGVDYSRAVFSETFETLVPTEKGELQALGKEIIGAPAGHVLLYKSTLPGVVTCNMTNCLDIDGTKTEELTAGTVVCRQQMDKIVSFLREYAPGYENCYIISSASLICVRETRHFKGIETITEQDITEARIFENYVVKDAYFNFDVHNISGAGLDKTGVQHKFTQNKGYTIPYGCLVPEKTDGLLLSGRNISGTHMAHSNFRAMPICVATGNAAGAAASVAVKEKCRLRDVSAEQIRQIVGINNDIGA